MDKNYSELLKDSRWLKKRLDILRRDHYQCTVCGSHKNLVVHHTFYFDDFPEPWLYKSKSLLTLCEACHHDFHCHNEVPLRHRGKPAKKGKNKPYKPNPNRKRKRKVRYSLANLQAERLPRYRKRMNGEWITVDQG